MVEQNFDAYFARKKAEREQEAARIQQQASAIGGDAGIQFINPGAGFLEGMEQGTGRFVPEMREDSFYIHGEDGWLFPKGPDELTGKYIEDPNYVAPTPTPLKPLVGLPGADGDPYAARGSGTEADDYIRRLEKSLPDLRQERDAAVRRSGSAAASQYNQAIAKVQAEIDRVQQQRVAMGGVFERQQAGTAAAFDKQAAGAAIGLANTRAIGDKNYADVMERIIGRSAPILRKTADSLQMMGVDPASMEATIESMQAMEDVYMEAVESSDENFRALTEAASEVAKAAALKSKYTTAFGLKVNEQVLDMQLQDQVNQLVEQKAELASARSRAVGAARSATARQFEDMGNFPMGEQMYAEFAVNRYLRDQVDALGVPISTMSEWGAMIENGLQNHMTYAQLRNTIFGYTYEEDRVTGERIRESKQANMPWLNNTQKQQYFDIVWNGMRLFQEGQQDYTDLLGQNAEEFAPYSVARTNVLLNNYLDEGTYTFSEAAQMAQAPENHETYKPRERSTVASKGLTLGGW